MGRDIRGPNPFRVAGPVDDGAETEVVERAMLISLCRSFVQATIQNDGPRSRLSADLAAFVGVQGH